MNLRTDDLKPAMLSWNADDIHSFIFYSLVPDIESPHTLTFTMMGSLEWPVKPLWKPTHLTQKLLWVFGSHIPNGGSSIRNRMSCVRSWWRVKFVRNITTPTGNYCCVAYAWCHNKMIIDDIILFYLIIEKAFSFTCILEQTLAPVITFTTFKSNQLDHLSTCQRSDNLHFFPQDDRFL